jgi:multiple sugar transport system ATP-binding protein
MNLFEGQLAFDGEAGAVQLGSQSLSLAPESLAAHPALRNYDGKKIIIGIRPEDLEDVAFASNVKDGATLQSTVQLIEALGSEIMVHFSLDAATVDSGDPDAVEETGVSANTVGRFHPRSRVRIGDVANIAVSTENMHFFDRETRNAIWS